MLFTTSHPASNTCERRADAASGLTSRQVKSSLRKRQSAPEVHVPARALAGLLGGFLCLQAQPGFPRFSVTCETLTFLEKVCWTSEACKGSSAEVFTKPVFSCRQQRRLQQAHLSWIADGTFVLCCPSGLPPPAGGAAALAATGAGEGPSVRAGVCSKSLRTPSAAGEAYRVAALRRRTRGAATCRSTTSRRYR